MIPYKSSFWDGKSNSAFIWCDGDFFDSSNNHTCKIQESAFDNISQDYEINFLELFFEII